MKGQSDGAKIGGIHTSPTLPRKKVLEVRRRLLEWFSKNGRTYPWRQPLSFWMALVAEILLIQTNADRVVPVFYSFLERYDTPEKALKAPAEEIEGLIKPLGFPYRAKLIQRAAQALAGRRLPARRIDRAFLMSLPGVGQYVASALLCFHFGRREPVVDTNVLRILERVFGFRSDKKSPHHDRYLWAIADMLLPRRRAREFNYALLDFGATVCKTRKPLCAACTLAELCASAGPREK
jgi:A/G-specific adenine glycosylase